MTSDSSKKRTDPLSAELRIYRWLGIPQFRKLVLGYARLRHRRRGGRNPNYHLQGLSMADVSAFLPRLRKNTRLHLISLGLLGLFWVGVAYRGLHCPEAVPISLFVLWLDIWCILLQRYHWLRIRQLQEKHRRLHRSKSPQK